eukprot:3139472-Rhodomonas_salina.1
MGQEGEKSGLGEGRLGGRGGVSEGSDVVRNHMVMQSLAVEMMQKRIVTQPCEDAIGTGAPHFVCCWQCERRNCVTLWT